MTQDHTDKVPYLLKLSETGLLLDEEPEVVKLLPLMVSWIFEPPIPYSWNSDP